MRLSEEEIHAIKSSILPLDPNATIYLFGSRADPKQKGGDIDLLIISDHLSDKDKLQIKKTLFDQIEEQKVDIIIAKDDTDPFVKIALKSGIRL